MSWFGGLFSRRAEKTASSVVPAQHKTDRAPMTSAPIPNAPMTSAPMTSALFSPLGFAGLEVDNRIVVSPMCQYSADDGCANDWHFTHLGMLANSGAGLLVVEATHVEQLGRITH